MKRYRTYRGARQEQSGAAARLAQAEMEHYWRCAQQAIDCLPAYPEGRFEGRGIVICGGGARYFPCVYVQLRLLRRLGCGLPVEVWHLGPEEMPARESRLLEGLDVRCVDALEAARRHPMRRLGGWECKPFAILHSRFEQVLYLDADNVPVRDPSYLLDWAPLRELGAVFWPDYGPLAPSPAAWRAFGLAWRDESDFESGQILLDKRRCWRPLVLTCHYSEHSDYYYRLVHGDKDTFHMAWRRLGWPYAMVPHPVCSIGGAAMAQHDFEGRVVFQHRNLDKWRLDGRNRRLAGFEHEQECLGYLEELRGLLGAAEPEGPGVAGAVTAGAGVSPGGAVRAGGVPAGLSGAAAGGVRAGQPNRLRGLRLCMMTVPRPVGYVDAALASLLASGADVHALEAVHLMADSCDSGYLGSYDHHRLLRVHRLGGDEAAEQSRRSVRGRFCYNYWRCLRMGLDAPGGLLVLEDDVLVRDGMLACLAQALDEMEGEHGLREYVLSLHTPRRLAGREDTRAGRWFLTYPPGLYFGTQGMYYPPAALAPLVELFWQEGVARAGDPGDVLIRRFAQQRHCLYNTVCDLVLHVGEVSTGLAGCCLAHNRSVTFHLPWQPAPGGPVQP